MIELRHLLQDLAYQGRALMRHLRPGSRMESLEALYRVVNGYLAELGVDYWLAWGTLLGYHREGRILLHDQDVDFGALATDYERIRDAAHRLPRGFTLYDTSHRHHGPKLYVDHRGWCADIYFHTAAEGLLRPTVRSRWVADTAPMPADQILPTRSATFLGLSTRVPARVEEHLVHCYRYLGPDARRDPATGYFHPVSDAAEPRR